MFGFKRRRRVFLVGLTGVFLVWAGSAAALSSTPDVHVPQTDGYVYTLVQSGNTVYVGGAFTQIGGVTRNHLAAFDATTGVVDPAWDPDVGGLVQTLAVSGDKVYAGGSFITVNGGATARNRLAAFNLADGASAATADPAWDPNMSDRVRALTVSGGKVYAGGDFLQVNGGVTGYRHLAAFNLADGASAATVDAAWAPYPNNDVYALLVVGSRLYAGGAFTTVNAGATTRNGLAAFNLADGASAATPDAAWDPNINGWVFGLAESGGKLYAGGTYGTVNGGAVTNASLSAFNLADGSAAAVADPAWDPSMGGVVYSVAVSGGKLFAGGNFNTVNGGSITRRGAAAFNLADGVSPAVADAWNPNATQQVMTITPSGSDGVLIGGFFGLPQLYLAGFSTAAFMPQAWVPVAAALLILGAALVALRARRAKRSA